MGFKGSRGAPRRSRGSRGRLGDPLGPLGWFDGSSDDSGGQSEGIKGSTRGPHGPINYLLTRLKVHKVSGLIW